MSESLPVIEPSASIEERYASLARTLEALLDGERDLIANLANASALLMGVLPSLNWAGFYFLRGRGLVVGPFQGRTACVRIAIGQGVCCQAVQTGPQQGAQGPQAKTLNIEPNNRLRGTLHECIEPRSACGDRDRCRHRRRPCGGLVACRRRLDGGAGWTPH